MKIFVRITFSIKNTCKNQKYVNFEQVNLIDKQIFFLKKKKEKKERTQTIKLWPHKNTIQFIPHNPPAHLVYRQPGSYCL